MAKGKYAQRRARRKRHGVSDQGQARSYLRVRESLPSCDLYPYIPRPEEESWCDTCDPWTLIVGGVVGVGSVVAIGYLIATH